MKDGFIKVAAITPKVKVADVKYNGEIIRKYMKEASEKGAKIVVFPEMCITAYSCNDLFLQDALLKSAKEELYKIAEFSENLDGLFFVGLPFEYKGNLYNVAAGISGGKILGFVPKSYIPGYNEFYETRQFTSGLGVRACIKTGDYEFAPLSANLIFECENMPNVRVAAEICEDLWTPNPPSISHALAGANIIVNLSASNEITGKSIYRKDLVSGQSARLICGYIYASAGDGESTQDVVYSGHNIIAENGRMLADSGTFATGITYAEIDVQHLENDRRRMTTFNTVETEKYDTLSFYLNVEETKISRYIDPAPFVPSDKEHRDVRCNEILTIQAMGLKKRLEHINCKTAVIGISGGLDSTLALLVTVKAFDLLSLDRKGIIAVTMPGFGTTDRTYDNALKLIKSLGAELKEISIVPAVNQHFADIGQEANNFDVTYENSQARERTQILMDIANKNNGIVIGTGDLSELALGWATYNGDHMSMYGVNSSVPKTLVRHLVRYYADTSLNEELKATLYDVLDTPVSPELLPPENGKISQKTEDLVGPYELHDFFLYHMLRFGSTPSKIYRLANIAFENSYDGEFILKWEKTFYRRFFAQHFKRSCLPDGPKVGSVAVSPRGDLRMPSDACGRLWMEELNSISN